MSTSIKKMHIIMHKYHYTSTRMAKINNNKNTKGWWGSRGTVSLIHCWWECKIIVTLGKKGGNFLQNHVYADQYPADVFLGICCRKLKTYVHTKTCTWLSITALFTVDPNWKQAKYPSVAECKTNSDISIPQNTI